MFRTGPRNLITDVAGLRVGNASDVRLKSGVTTIVCDEPAVAGVQILGGAPGTRETDLLEPHNSIEAIHAVVLSGGSAFGLDAASGVQAALREWGIGVEVGGFRVPIVPAAILFDLRNGGDKDWGRYPPYRDLGYEAAQAVGIDFPLGTVGAGSGALSSGLKGGLGSASTVLDSGVTIGALAAVNPTGSVTIAQTRHFWAAPFEIGDEFGGLGYPSPMPEDAKTILLKFRDKHIGKRAKVGGNTTIAIIATDAVLTKAAAKRLAISAHDGFVRAIWPTHTPADGDLVFALATGMSGIELAPNDAIDLYAAAGATMSRAISRGVFAATPAEGDLFPVWSSR
ncbi:MAG: S58 family peptidase [Mesorhizobium sp.]|uniref:P1 family peptidase n=2 Tax=Mesorhizobium sp. TaxID=1871066 RepID=UPI000FE60584|nr:P1 family peptidase [Mesorhizobium sp.]RWH76598.1 MAG: S58 family peptidase [Mesorhizobium sp.]RWH80089.1 MAG: S58 family peptidase [Mesorhizobium sp.]RWH89314.1 MAG: S58 family peptidase [Mesorhizobium sp.]RWI01976.1 MAG: S58 family peptidase [Mesorhizobium sp.]RWI03589.1 MAG: S58 family peptidase [Mesorhizobium sp.]